MQSQRCPLCGWMAFERRHPKHPGDTIDPTIQIVAHLRLHHQDEIERRAKALGQS